MDLTISTKDAGKTSSGVTVDKTTAIAQARWASLSPEEQATATRKRLQSIANQCHTILLHLVADLEADVERRCRLCSGRIALVNGMITCDCPQRRATGLADSTDR